MICVVGIPFTLQGFGESSIIKLGVTWYPAALESFSTQSTHIATFFPTKMSTVCNLLTLTKVMAIYYMHTQITKEQPIASSSNRVATIGQLFLGLGSGKYTHAGPCSVH